MSKKVIQNENTVRSLTVAEFQRQCFEEVLDFFKQIRIQESLKSEFTKREVTELLTYFTIPELYQKCKEQLQQLRSDYPYSETDVGIPMDHRK